MVKSFFDPGNGAMVPATSKPRPLSAIPRWNKSTNKSSPNPLSVAWTEDSSSLSRVYYWLLLTYYDTITYYYISFHEESFLLWESSTKRIFLKGNTLWYTSRALRVIDNSCVCVSGTELFNSDVLPWYIHTPLPTQHVHIIGTLIGSVLESQCM